MLHLKLIGADKTACGQPLTETYALIRTFLKSKMTEVCAECARIAQQEEQSESKRKPQYPGSN